MLEILNRKSKTRSKIYPLLFSIALITLLIFTSCEQKKPEEVSIPKDTLLVKVEEPAAVDTQLTITTDKKELGVTIPDLKGKWTGTFDKRTTRLRITDQDGKTFKGSITINYREVINQQVSGTINEKAMEFTMKDLLHSRYAGTYGGKYLKI